MFLRNTPLTESFPQDLNTLILSYVTCIFDGIMRDGHILIATIAMGMSIEIIQRVGRQNPRYPAIESGLSVNGIVNLNYVLYASLHPDNKVLDLILQKYPKKANQAFDILNKLRAYKEPFKCGRLFYPELFSGASRKLFQAMTSRPADLMEHPVLNFLLIELNAENTISGWLQIYEKNVGYLSTAETVKRSIFKTIPYSYAKIQFIQRVQTKIYKFLHIETFIGVRPEYLYHTISQYVLKHDVFSKKHEHYGVSDNYRLKLEARVARTTDVLRKTPGKQS